MPSVQKKTGPVAGDVKSETGDEAAADNVEKRHSKAKGGKKASKSAQVEGDGTKVEPGTNTSRGKKRSVKTEDEEPTGSGQGANGGDADEPVSNKRKGSSKAGKEGEIDPKRQKKAKADTKAVKSEPEPEKGARRRSTRVSGTGI